MKSRVERLMVGPIGENVYAVESGGIGVLVDPGDDPDGILDFLGKKGIPISLIVLTHGHLDHTAAIPALFDAWRAQPPRLAIHFLDASYLGPKAEEVNKARLRPSTPQASSAATGKPSPNPTFSFWKATLSQAHR